MLVEFVSSGYMTFYQTLGILLGSGIGSTTASQIMAFNVRKYSLYFIAVGFILSSSGRTNRAQQTGLAIMGLGLLFYGTDVMSHSVTPLRTYPPFIKFLIEMTNHPFMSLTISIVFTAAIQSSNATIGIIIVLASEHLVDLQSSIIMVLGSNIGTGMTALIAALTGTNENPNSLIAVHGSREALKVAIANIFFKIAGVIIIFPLLSVFRSTIELHSSNDVARQIANSHSFFNVIIALIFLPFSRTVANTISRLLPEKKTPLLKC